LSIETDTSELQQSDKSEITLNGWQTQPVFKV